MAHISVDPGLDSQALARIDLLAMTTAATVAIAAIAIIIGRGAAVDAGR